MSTLPVPSLDGALPSSEEKNSILPEAFLCSAEYHLAREVTGLAIVVYNLALRLSHKSGVFNAAASSVAHYFDYSIDSVQKAYRQLRESGYFEELARPNGRPTEYRVLTHDEWAKQHPHMCCEKWERRDEALLSDRPAVRNMNSTYKVDEQLWRFIADHSEEQVLFDKSKKKTLSKTVADLSPDLQELQHAFEVFWSKPAHQNEYGAKLFSESADQLIYTARRKKQEREAEQA